MGGGETGTRVRGRTEKVPSRSIDSSGRTRRRRIRRRSGARRRRGGPRGERDDAPRICRAPETRETEDLGPCVCASRSPASFFGGDRRARILYRDALPVGYLTTRRALGSPRRDGKTASDCDEHLRKLLTKIAFFLLKLGVFFGDGAFGFEDLAFDDQTEMPIRISRGANRDR